MGYGYPPGPVDGHDRPFRVDEGTMSRTWSRPPGPAGLGSKGTSKEQGSPAPPPAEPGPTPATAPAPTATPPPQAPPGVDRDRIVRFAVERLGEHVKVKNHKECFDLVDEALAQAGARRADTYQEITEDGDYQWGDSLGFSEVQPGDVVQFSDYSYEFTTVDGEGNVIETWTMDRPHHSAIVESVAEDGTVTILEQNAPVGSPVTRTELRFNNDHYTDGGETTTVTVQGGATFYRPQPALPPPPDSDEPPGPDSDSAPDPPPDADSAPD